MIVILIIVALVAAVSIYDYFTTRTWQQVTSTVRNEAVFENRNKKYGAFVIRRDYNRNFILILLGMIGGVGVIYAATSLTKAGAPKEFRVKPPVPEEGIIVKLDEKAEEPKPEVAKPKLAVPPVTNKFVEPKIVTEPDPKEKPEIDPNVNSGTQTIPKTDGDLFVDPTKKGDPKGDPKGEGEEIKQAEKPKIPDVFAEYPGGKEALMKFLQKNLSYPQVAAETGVGGKCYIRFVVSKTGEISEITVAKNIKLCPECGEEAKRVVRKMPRWKPGSIKGEPVDSYFSLPIEFQPEIIN